MNILKNNKLTSLWLSLLASALHSATPAQQLYIGTYSGGHSEGIYNAPFDPATGDIGPVELAAKTENPSFLTADATGRFLYAVNETDAFNGDPTGGVSVFETGRGWRGLKLLQQVSSLGAAPAHLSLDRSGRFLLVANYNGGNVAVFPVEEDGKLGPASAFVQESGVGVDRDRQAGPHAHFIQTTRDNRFALNADLGLDKVFIYRFNSSTGTLTAGAPPFVKMNPGAGPRHLAFAPFNGFVYVLNELSSTVTVIAQNSSQGTWRIVQSLSTLPKKFSGENTAAEIAVDPQGRFLYVSNRGHDSLGVFRIRVKDGRVSPVEWVLSGGKTPRHFAIDPSGQWLLAANQNSDNVQPFRINPNNGRLTRHGDALPVPTPACVFFAKVLLSTEAAAALPSAQEEVGNDPTVLRSRFELGDEYFNNSGGPDWHLLTARVDGAPTPKLGFRLDLPYMFLVPQGYPHSMDRGLADVMFRGSAVIKKTPRAGFTAYCDLWFDTAESADFGLGKYSAGPAVAVAGMNPFKDTLLSASLQHKFSYAGDSARTDIRRTRVEFIMDKSFRERQWIVLNPVIFMDWVTDKSAGDLECETGVRMGDHWVLWARPGVGLWGQEVSGGYNSYLQAGARYIFGQPLREKFLGDLRRTGSRGANK